MTELYFSTDIEADGPIPGAHSMLSIASVALRPDKSVLGEFSANLITLPGATQDPKTMAWWRTQGRALAQAQASARDPAQVMREYADWVESFGEAPVFVAYPASFDFMFVTWYLHRFAGRSPFAHSALDLKTLAMAVLNTEFHGATKSGMPKAWFERRPHTHRALDDARAQGVLFCNMLAAARGAR